MLIIFTQPALNANKALETLDIALSAASLNQPVKLVFLAAGVGLLQESSNQQLLSPANKSPNKNHNKHYSKSFLARLKALSLFGINEIFVAEVSLAVANHLVQNHLADSLGLKITQLNQQQLHQLVSQEEVFVG